MRGEPQERPPAIGPPTALNPSQRMVAGGARVKASRKQKIGRMAARLGPRGRQHLRIDAVPRGKHGTRAGEERTATLAAAAGGLFPHDPRKLKRSKVVKGSPNAKRRQVNRGTR